MHFPLKPLALLALTSSALCATVQSQYGADAIIPFAEEPTLSGPDGVPTFVHQPGYSDANATRSLDFESAVVSEQDDESGVVNGRELQVVEGVIVAFNIAAMAAPIIADMIKNNKKECQQLACWIATDSRTCALSVAERVQADITQGRDRFRYEKMEAKGMWVRFWRTKFEPTDRGDVVTGKCTNGVNFAVTNCMSTAKVHC